MVSESGPGGYVLPFSGRNEEGAAVWFCYILECSDGSYYAGITTNPKARVAKHNAGYGSAYTAARRPVRLVWSEEHESRSSATARERQIKRWNRERKRALIVEQ